MPPALKSSEREPLISGDPSVKVSQNNYNSADFAKSSSASHESGDLRHRTPQPRVSAASPPLRRYVGPRPKGVDYLLWVIVVDVIFTFVLWLTGANSEHFVAESITSFHFESSVFDLALLGALKSAAFFPLVAAVESGALKKITCNTVVEFRSPRRRLLSEDTGFVAVVVFVVVDFLFVFVKACYVLDAYVQDESYEPMSAEWNSLLALNIVFVVPQIVLIWLLPPKIRRMQQHQKEVLLKEKEEAEAAGNSQAEEPKKKPNLGRLLRMAKPELPLILTGLVFLCGSSGSQMVSPLFFGKVVDASMTSTDDLAETALTLLGIYLAANFCGFLRSWIFTLAGERFVARVRRRTFISIINQDVGFFDSTKTGELTNRLASDTQVIQNAVTVNISMLVRYTLQIVGSIVLMFGLSARLTGVLLAVVPVVSLASVVYGKFIGRIRKKYQDKLAVAGATAEESISQVRTVRAFAAEQRTIEAYSEDINATYAMGKKLALLNGIFQGMVGALAFGSITLVLWYGGTLVYQKELTPGVLTSFLMYTLTVAMAFAFLAGLYGDFMQAVGASVRIFELMDRKPEIAVSGGEADDDIHGGIEFEKVCFTYPTRKDTKVLSDVSFKVDPGQVVALVGPSGGGKSTIVQLLEKFYVPESGNIYIGGENVSKLDPSWMRQRVMSLVSQEPTLFAGSIAENIAYGKRGASEQEVRDAAKQANALEFIEGFEDKFETVVGERGVRLSGGQKQRIAIARALIMNPKILLLDEATSALDAESEHLVQEAIDRAMKSGKRTVLVIAHRLSTVRNAHVVVVIQGGRVAETGTHDSLMALGGVYKKLVQRQLAAGEGMLGGEREEGEGDSGEGEGESREGDREREVGEGREEEVRIVMDDDDDDDDDDEDDNLNSERNPLV